MSVSRDDARMQSQRLGGNDSSHSASSDERGGALPRSFGHDDLDDPRGPNGSFNVTPPPQYEGGAIIPGLDDGIEVPQSYLDSVPHYDDELGGDVGEGFYGGVGGGGRLDDRYDEADLEDAAALADLPDDVRELFKYINHYEPQVVELETTLKPFVPDFIPAVGDIDGYLKITRPDGVADGLALEVLDEPASQQSDPTVLELQLRARAKKQILQPEVVRSIEDAENNEKAVRQWVESINQMHREAPTVRYGKNMPDIEQLMQVWPEEYEAALKSVPLPGPDLDVPLETYVDIVCGLLDIPVYDSRIQSLHILFTLYDEAKRHQGVKL